MKIRVKKNLIKGEAVDIESLTSCGEDFLRAVEEYKMCLGSYSVSEHIWLDSIISTGCLLFLKVCCVSFIHHKMWLLKSHFTDSN